MDKEKNIEQQEKDLFNKLKIDYSRSKEDIWKSMEAGLEEQGPVSLPIKKSGRIISMKRISRNIAAAVVLVVGLGLFARFYTVTHEVEAGSLATHTLPDGSIVNVNAESVVSWSPYWWKYDRTVKLKGEAYFEVEKGSEFSVVSKEGITTVLGTSFNIYARGTDYQVYCVTGQVKVADKLGRGVILVPGEFASISETEPIREVRGFSVSKVLAWRLNKFVYNTTPLSKVFEDVERHYGITIESSGIDADDYNYTGLFERSVSPQEALEIICFTFGLEVEKQDELKFSVGK